jgi:hypothetical protein
MGNKQRTFISVPTAAPTCGAQERPHQSRTRGPRTAAATPARRRRRRGRRRRRPPVRQAPRRLRRRGAHPRRPSPSPPRRNGLQRRQRCPLTARTGLRSVSQPASQSARRSVSESDGRTVSQSVSETHSRSVGRSREHASCHECWSAERPRTQGPRKRLLVPRSRCTKGRPGAVRSG